MITDEMLRKAAAKSNEIYINYFENTYDPENQHMYSPQFEKRIEDLKRKAKCSFFYSSAQRAASIILAVVLSISVWLSIDVEAREVFFGWIKEMYDTLFVYKYEEISKEDVTPQEYHLTWIPEGYKELFVDENDEYHMAIYIDDIGAMLTFKYTYNPSETDWFVDVSQMQRKQVTVNGYCADLLISKEPQFSNIILWVTPENTAFYISAFLSEGELIRIAESVQEKNK